MGVRADAALALILALGLHGAALVLMGGKTTAGATAAGDGGTELVTIAPVAGDVAALIASWDAPPMVADVPSLPEPVTEAVTDLPPPTQPEPIDAPAAELTLPPIPEAIPAMTPPAPPKVTLPPEVSLPETPAPVVQANPDLRPKPRPAPKPTSNAAAPPKPKPERTPKPAPVPAAQSAGEGGGGSVGQDGQAQAGTEDSAGTEDAVSAWGADIRARIEREKTYPRGANGATGVVTLVITVTPQGALGSVTIAASSGNPVLDAAAVKAVQSARLPKGPAGIDPTGHNFRFRLRYER